jgi:hypothetical protein
VSPRRAALLAKFHRSGGYGPVCIRDSNGFRTSGEGAIASSFVPVGDLKPTKKARR